MNNDLISLEPIERREPAKIKTHFARIIVGGQIEKPYYSILWFEPANMEYQIGYSSYCLEYVFRWLKEDFEITGDGFANEPMVHAYWIDRDGKTWCSKCGASNKAYKPPFCPHCGARMGEEKNHDQNQL